MFLRHRCKRTAAIRLPDIFFFFFPLLIALARHLSFLRARRGAAVRLFSPPPPAASPPRLRTLRETSLVLEPLSEGWESGRGLRGWALLGSDRSAWPGRLHWGVKTTKNPNICMLFFFFFFPLPGNFLK